MKPILVLCTVLTLSIFSFGQKQAYEYNKVEVFAGYSAATLLAGDDSLEPVESGFNAAAVYNFHRYIGIKVDVSGTYRGFGGPYFSATVPGQEVGQFRARHSLYNALGGVQFKNNKRDATLKPFAHVMVGAARHEDNFTTTCPAGAICPEGIREFTGLSVVIGGGLDVKVNRRIDIRAFQLDLNPISIPSSGAYNNFRFSSGIVFKFR